MHLITLLISIFCSSVSSLKVGLSDGLDYTDAYSRSEIEMMKNAGTSPGSDPTGVNNNVNKPKPNKPTNWYLLHLSGNTTVVHKRLPDFLNYLKINLGGLASSDYENVSINSISYVPTLIVNISFSGNYSVKQLETLAARNDSILVLSLTPFYLTSLTSHRDILIPKPFTNSLSTAREEEALIYLAIGAAIAFVLSAGVLVSILILVKKKDRIKDKEPLIRAQSRSFTRYQDPPQMIYSETFSQGLEREKERLHQFTPIDDNFAPIETEVDFVPRYIKDDERASWLSEGSILDTTASSSNCNHKKNLSTFSDEGSEADRRSQMSKSPFYWTLESHSPTPSSTMNGNTSVSVSSPSSQSSSKKKPPRPPSRTDSLNPRSTSKRRPQSSILTNRQHHDSTIPSRRLSVPVPYHMSSRPGSVLSNHSSIPPPSPTFPPAPAISQEQIDKDVHSILRNLDVVEEAPLSVD